MSGLGARGRQNRIQHHGKKGHSLSEGEGEQKAGGIPHLSAF